MEIAQSGGKLVLELENDFYLNCKNIKCEKLYSRYLGNSTRELREMLTETGRGALGFERCIEVP